MSRGDRELRAAVRNRRPNRSVTVDTSKPRPEPKPEPEPQQDLNALFRRAVRRATGQEHPSEEN